jgi:hypothetical protein
VSHAGRASLATVSILHLLGGVGLFAFVYGHGSLLGEGVHALGHVRYQPTLPARLFGDHTPMPALLGLLVTVTVLLLTGSEALLDRNRPAEEGRGVRTAAAGLVGALGLLLVVTAFLWRTDFAMVPREDQMNPLWLGSVFSLVLGFASLLFLVVTGRPSYGWVFGSIPAATSTLFTLIPSVRRAARVPFMPPLFPRPGWVLPAITALVALAFVARWSTRRWAPESQGLVPLVTGIWAWVLLSAVQLGLIVPMHHMCWSSEFVEVQAWAVPRVVCAFLVPWGVLAAIQHRRYLQIRRDSIG